MIALQALLAIGLLPYVATAQASCSTSAGPAAPSSSFCTGDCATTFEATFAFEQATLVDPDVGTAPSFYDVPSDLDTSNATAGGIIKWEDFTPDAYANWTIPGGASLSRFLYWTEDVNGTLLPASAFLLLPYHVRPDTGKMRTIVWAHGTAGYARKCAPSNQAGLYYDFSAPFAYVQDGYAVVAPDYTGLGTEIPQTFMYVAAWSHAADVIFSLVAARKQWGSVLSDEWVCIGQSEGGAVAWRVNQRLAIDHQESFEEAGTFLGSVSIAPANRPLDGIDARAAGNTDLQQSDPGVYVLRTISHLYPDQLNTSDYLSPTAQGRLVLAGQSCAYGAAVLFANFTETFSNMSWTTSDAANDWRKTYNREGLTSLAAPLLVIQGSADVYVPVYVTEEDFNATCSAEGQNISAMLYLYEDLDHDVVTNMGQADYMPWVDARFDGIEAPKGCSNLTFSAVSSSGHNPVANQYVANV